MSESIDLLPVQVDDRLAELRHRAECLRHIIAGIRSLEQQDQQHRDRLANWWREPIR